MYEFNFYILNFASVEMSIETTCLYVSFLEAMAEIRRAKILMVSTSFIYNKVINEMIIFQNYQEMY